MQSWAEPIVEWQPPANWGDRHADLLRRGELLARWPALPFEETDTDCFQFDRDYWIWQPGVGGIHFRDDEPRLRAFPSQHVDSTWFTHLVYRSWLPPVYQVWGRQVLHASAVACRTTGDVVAFAGPSCAGKSTLAYALSRRGGWRLVCDDSLAFSVGERSGQVQVDVHKLQAAPRLRPATAAHFGCESAEFETLEWPADPLRLAAIYFVEGDPEHPHVARIEKLNAPSAYLRLLEQAHALSFKIPKHNQQLMRDYLAVASTIPVFGLTYRKSFDVMDQLLDVVEEHTKNRT